jgi:hypothetical protein
MVVLPPLDAEADSIAADLGAPALPPAGARQAPEPVASAAPSDDAAHDQPKPKPRRRRRRAPAAESGSEAPQA